MPSRSGAAVTGRSRVDDSRTSVGPVPHHRDADSAVTTAEQHGQDEQDHETVTLHRNLRALLLIDTIMLTRKNTPTVEEGPLCVFAN